MTKKYLFKELRDCVRIALDCDTYRSAVISVHEARGMIKLAYMYDIINSNQFRTLCSLRRQFDAYLFNNKPL